MSYEAGVARDLRNEEASEPDSRDVRETLRAMPPPSWSDFPAATTAALRSYRAPASGVIATRRLQADLRARNVVDEVRTALQELGEEDGPTRFETLEFEAVVVEEHTVDVDEPELSWD